MEEIKAFLLANKDRIAEGIRRFEDAEKQVGEDFAKTYASIRAMMERKGCALPDDPDEFLNWYVYVKNAFVTPAEFVENWKGLMLSDFREFAEYKERLFDHGGKIGDLPAQVLPPAQVAPESLTFERVFVGVPEMETAVKAVHGTDFDASKLTHLRAFFAAAKSSGLTKPKVKEYKALPLIAEYFGGYCNQSAAYNALIDERLESTLTKRMETAKK